jgi:integrase
MKFLSLTSDKIDWNANQITFKQLKTRGSIEETVITYPITIIHALKQYIGDRQGFSDSDIQKVTGHASSEMVNAYDKRSRADNASKKVSLVN